MTDKDFSIDTKLIHAGEPNPRIKGAVSMPIFQSSNFEYEGETSYDSVRYIRLNNTPNHVVLHQKIYFSSYPYLRFQGTPIDQT